MNPVPCFYDVGSEQVELIGYTVRIRPKKTKSNFPNYLISNKIECAAMGMGPFYFRRVGSGSVENETDPKL